MSAEKNDGGSAFPTIPPLDPQHGMSLRDWFAGQALTGLFINRDNKLYRPEDFARWAYEHADAMLKARGAPSN